MVRACQVGEYCQREIKFPKSQCLSRFRFDAYLLIQHLLGGDYLGEHWLAAVWSAAKKEREGPGLRLPELTHLPAGEFSACLSHGQEEVVSVT